MPQLNLMYPRPVGWEAPYKYGGNCMCEITGGFISNVGQYITLDGNCASQSIEVLYTYTFESLAAILFTTPNLTSPNLCNHELQDPAGCRRFISAALPFITNNFQPTALQAILASAHAIKLNVQTGIQLQFLQYLYYPETNDLELIQTDVFDNSNFEFFAWLYLIDWINSYREVVRFEGSSGTTTLISGAILGRRTLANPQEIPTNVAYYTRVALEYMTYVLIGVAGFVCISIATNRGHIEGWNMLAFNRVAGLVWIGRPLMMLRGITAISLLSTATLNLTRPLNGITTQFVHVQSNWLTTLLSSGEMSWFVYVVNDLFSVVTQGRTKRYAMFSSLLVWLLTTIWSFVQPVEHFVTIDRQCTVVVVDFQLECNIGTLAIGRQDRFWGLLILASGCCVVAYAADQALFAANPPPMQSSLLHASATHHFAQTNWIFDGQYHLDYASAVLTGLVAIPFRNGRVVALNIKTWRVVILSGGTTKTSSKHDYSRHSTIRLDK
ncbi:Aste57867_6048 [Aphanomyces stellatus]|uniref:Aste57867_6048 protein n=1 Tax=Aphanomyces stellatus TaxID=120398 RepID=A0A485KDT5_9STRA|nr:hypothetical protein As57867_006034 [Aphanomyces stellatus]VFT83061.1 Aste57867_6048 [Aphanomyces stellatus]